MWIKSGRLSNYRLICIPTLFFFCILAYVNSKFNCFLLLYFSGHSFDRQPITLWKILQVNKKWKQNNSLTPPGQPMKRIRKSRLWRWQWSALFIFVFSFWKGFISHFFKTILAQAIRGIQQNERISHERSSKSLPEG